MELDEEEMQYDFREGNPYRYLNYIHWILNEEPQYQCPECSKCFKHAFLLRMHTTKEKVGDLCSYFRTRLAGQPPFTVLSFDGRTFMCNFGCSLVTEDRAIIIKHILTLHK